MRFARKRTPALLALLAALALGGGSAEAAGPPQVASTWVSGVSATGADLRAQLNPNGLATSYHFDYVTEAQYLANLTAVPPKDGFSGAARVPVATDPSIGSGSSLVAVVQHLSSLKTGTAYRFRAVAQNEAGTTLGPARILRTDETAPVFSLPDGRAWELVSPIDKNGGDVAGFGAIFGGGVLQAAAGGGAVTYGSANSFAGGEGAPGASQYLATRGGGGWATANLTVPLYAGGYASEAGGVPYRLFSSDLALGLLSNGVRCRAGGEDCPVANPPLAGTDAPAGYRNYYLRDNSLGGFEAVVGPEEIAYTSLPPERFELAFAGSDPNLAHPAFSTCAALTADASEVSDGSGGCDPEAQNLYLWGVGGLELVNAVPGASLGAQAGAVSADGSRVYWSDGTALYLREAGEEPVQVDSTLGGGAQFEAASTDGAVAYLTKGGHLYRFLASGSLTDLTPAGGVSGVLGTSVDGSHVYYATGDGIFLWHDGATTAVTEVPGAADVGNFPPATGTARVSADGSILAFASSAVLGEYDNNGRPEVYVYGPPVGGGAPSLVCASCNRSGERPLGPSGIPGATANGLGAAATQLYKPRSLSASGRRLVFDSADALLPFDTNGENDVYQWTAQGSGGCARVGGCVALLSSGRGPDGASFVDASADGGDVFFLTAESLLPFDPGAVDLYDARIGGGFVLPQPPTPCLGDACQPLPSPPDDLAPGTLLSGPGNPPARFPKAKKKKKKKKHHARRHGGKHKQGKRKAHR